MFEDCWFDVVNELKEEKCDKEEMGSRGDGRW